MNDLVTVYIPTKNRVELLKRAIASVLGQTARSIELIIVSDGSEDSTCDYVNSIVSDIDIVLVKNEKSVGACEARNQAIRVAKGKFITGLDDDDIFLPHRLASFMEHWKKHELAGEKFSCLFDRRILNKGWGVQLWDTQPTVSKDLIRTYNAVGNQVFTTPERLLGAGLFDPAMPAWQDWEMWVRLLDRFGPAKSINSNTYIMDVSHEHERISNKAPAKILQGAGLFYLKHCTSNHVGDVLRSLTEYESVHLTVKDLWLLAVSGNLRIALRQIKAGKYRWSLASSLPVAAV